MANWRSAGHAIRRRSGAPSAHSDSVGIGGRVSLPTPEEALAGMARVGSPRVPMGNDAIPSPNVVPVLRGTLMPKSGNAKGGAPWEGPTGHRDFIAQERLGAARTVTVSTPPMTDPAAGATTANGRVVPSAIGREDSFGDGINGAYAGY